MKNKLEQIREKAISQLNNCDTADKLNEIRVSILGKKGELTDLLKSMRDVPPQERPKVGQMVNETRRSRSSWKNAGRKSREPSEKRRWRRRLSM